jgi:hypothetical protein
MTQKKKAGFKSRRCVEAARARNPQFFVTLDDSDDPLKLAIFELLSVRVVRPRSRSSRAQEAAPSYG